MTNSILNPKFALNILIHVAILFTILSLFFSKFISKVASNAINNEIQHIIESSISSSKDYKQQLLDKYNELKKNALINDELINNDKIQNIKRLLEQIPNTNINIPSFSIDDLVKNIDYSTFDYYLKLFSKEDRTRQNVNTQVFNKIMTANIIIVIFVIIISILFIYNKMVSFNEFKHIMIDNIVTFIFVGIVEVIFFINIALKFIPAPPSLIYTSFIDSMKEQFKLL